MKCRSSALSLLPRTLLFVLNGVYTLDQQIVNAGALYHRPNQESALTLHTKQESVLAFRLSIIKCQPIIKCQRWPLIGREVRLILFSKTIVSWIPAELSAWSRTLEHFDFVRTWLRCLFAVATDSSRAHFFPWHFLLTVGPFAGLCVGPFVGLFVGPFVLVCCYFCVLSRRARFVCRITSSSTLEYRDHSFGNSRCLRATSRGVSRQELLAEIWDLFDFLHDGVHTTDTKNKQLFFFFVSSNCFFFLSIKLFCFEHLFCFTCLTYRRDTKKKQLFFFVSSFSFFFFVYQALFWTLVLFCMFKHKELYSIPYHIDVPL